MLSIVVRVWKNAIKNDQYTNMVQCIPTEVLQLSPQLFCSIPDTTLQNQIECSYEIHQKTRFH